MSIHLRFASCAVILLAACGDVDPPDVPVGPRPGHITYTDGDDVYRLAAEVGAAPENVSAQITRGARAADRRLNLSAGGVSYVFETSNVDPVCADRRCLAVASAADPGDARLVLPDGERIENAENLAAVDDAAAIVVYAAGGGPHDRDLFATLRSGDTWSAPRLLTAGSTFAWNDQPSLAPDADRLLFDCGPEANAGPGGSICEVGLDGAVVTIVATPDDAPAAIAQRGPLHHAAYAGADVIFEADWDGERIWRWSGDRATALTPPTSTNDNSPCVLPDGRIASLYLDDPGNPNGLHELKVMDASGADPTLLVTGLDLDDLGLGCGR